MAASFLEVRDVFLRKKRYVPLFFCIGLSGGNGEMGLMGYGLKGMEIMLILLFFCMSCTLFYRLNEDFGEFVC